MSDPKWHEVFEAHFRRVSNPGVWEGEIAEAIPGVTQSAIMDAVRALSRKAGADSFTTCADVIAEIKLARVKRPKQDAHGEYAQAIRLNKRNTAACETAKEQQRMLTPEESAEIWENICAGGTYAERLEAGVIRQAVGFMRPEMGNLAGIAKGIGDAG